MNQRQKEKVHYLPPVVTPEEAKQIPYPYVYVNNNGSVRELHTRERLHLETQFEGADGGQPYIKRSFMSRNGWLSREGYCHRSNIPTDINILAAPTEEPKVLLNEILKRIIGIE